MLGRPRTGAAQAALNDSLAPIAEPDNMPRAQAVHGVRPRHRPAHGHGPLAGRDVGVNLLQLARQGDTLAAEVVPLQRERHRGAVAGRDWRGAQEQRQGDRPDVHST